MVAECSTGYSGNGTYYCEGTVRPRGKRALFERDLRVRTRRGERVRTSFTPRFCLVLTSFRSRFSLVSNARLVSCETRFI